MKEVPIAAIALLVLASVSTILVYIVSLQHLLGLQIDYASIMPDGVPSSARKSVRKFAVSNEHAQVSLNFTNDLAHITHDDEWPSLNPQDFLVKSDTGEEYAIAMHQQLHCLNIVRMAYLSFHVQDRPEPSPTLYAETEMCLEQLRQLVVCGADLTLEPTKMTIDNDGVILPGSNGVDVLHRCRDWRKLDGIIAKPQRA